MTRLSKTLLPPKPKPTVWGATPQSRPLPGQVQNSAGGFTYMLDYWGALDRFLILGTEGGTFYATEKTLTREAAANVVACWSIDAPRTAARIAEISDAGRAPKNSPAIFALALGASHEEAEIRQAALRVLPAVCRTSTHLFEFVATCRDLGRGFGRALKGAVRSWYESKPADALAYQAIKYRERQGYSHKRMVQQAHPRVPEEDKAKHALMRWICGHEFDAEAVPVLVAAHLVAMKTEDPAERLRLIKDHRLPWEALPTEALKDPEIWRAMAPHLGLTALIRNLGTLARLGLTGPMSDMESLVRYRLSDEAEIRKSRIHPFALLQASVVYKSGTAVRGSTTWKANPKIVQALDKAFPLSFSNVIPTGKRHLLALDVSSSMDSGTINGGVVTARDASAAMALITINVEPETHCVAFTASSAVPGGRFGRGADAITQLDIPKAMPLATLKKELQAINFGSTDCAQPMLYALHQKVPVDVFVVYTDNETWHGSIHPSEALKRYRNQMGIPDAKLVVVGMTSTKFTIADPRDPNMLDVVGMDTDTPAAIAEFVRS